MHKHNKFFGVAVIFLTLCQPTKAQTLSKTQLTVSPELGIYSNIEWLDLDGDNDMDLVELYSDPNDDANSFVRVFRNDSESFSEMQNAFSDPSLDPRHYDFNDADNDGDIDFLFLDNEGIKIALNSGGFTFTIQYTSITNSSNWHTEIHWQDLDSDQDLDIVFDNLIYMNTDGVYHPALRDMPFYTRNRSWADVNNDGYLDMVATKGQSHNLNPLFLFLNQGDGLFKESSQLSPGFFDSGQTQWLDADADADLDLFITEEGEKCTLLQNTFSESGTVDFQPVSSFKTISNPRAAVGDLDLDGLPDIIISGQGYPTFETYLYRNTSAGGEISFEETDLEIKPYLVSNLDLVDMDGDLDLDLFLLGWEDGWYSVKTQDVYIIDPGRTRPLPDVPGDLGVAVEDAVTLSWDHNANQGTAYFDLSIKLDGAPFISGLALPNGKLLAPAFAKFQPAREISLYNLPPGNYEWRVQAFDHAYRASGFSTSSSFTVISPPTGLTLDVLAYNKVELNWTFSGTATGFAILRRSSNGALTEIGTVPGNTLTYTDADVPPNEHVEYVVKAVLNGSHSAPSISVAYYSEQFEEITFNPAGPNIITASGLSADFDHDQDYDLGFIGRIDHLSGTSRLLNNNGAALYTDVSFLPINEELTDPIFARDMDNDGDIDVCAVIGGAGSYKVAIYKNNGGSFTMAFETPAYAAVSQVASDDMNHDGLPDLMIKRPVGNSSGGTPTYELLFQTIGGDFSDSRIAFLASSNTFGLGDVYLADVTNDGFTDVIFSGVANNVNAKVFANVNGNTFKETPLNLSSLTDPVFFDFTGDGKTDIVQRGFQVLYLHNGLGNAQFGNPQEISIAGLAVNESIEVKIADMDFNGWPDLIVNDSYNTTLLYNTGQGNFARADYKFAGDWDTHVLLTDMEGDGDLDLVKQGNDGSHQGINYYYKNLSSPGENAAPASPTSLQVARSKNATTLTWAGSTDDTTPSELISYHVQLWDGNGKRWVHGETNAGGTFRRILAYGNAGFRTSYTISNLPAGHYTAHVQAVDASFKLSATSSVVTFDIAVGPSSLTTERILLNKVKLTWADGPLNGTGTIVERKSLDTDFEIIAELGGNVTTYTDEGLHYDNLYTYQVYEKAGATVTAGSNRADWNTTLLILQQSTITNVTGSLDVGDYTGDGKMDMLIFGGRLYNGNTVDLTSALLEKATNGWTQQNAGSAVIPNFGTSHFYDINDDHRIDVYQHGYVFGDDEYKTQVFLNNGDKTFTEVTNTFTTKGLNIAETWDYDRDNDIDYYVSQPGAAGMSVFRNNGMDGFEQNTTLGSCCDNTLVPGDFDRDGDEDVIHYNPTSNYFTLSLNQDGAMHPNVNFHVSGGRMQRLDYNGDGWPDLLFIAESGFNVKSMLYKNLGLDASGIIQFKIIKDDLPAGEVTSNAADYDHDGDLDIFFTGEPCAMFNNLGNDVFKEISIPDFSVGMNNTRWVDFDADGDLDLFMMGYFTVNNAEGIDQPYGYVLNNQLIVAGNGIANQAPPAPDNLTYHQDTEGLHLAWDGHADDHTPIDALSYDVVIYKDGKEILKGMFDPVNGLRHKLQEGRSSKSLLLDNLSYGSYTWKVQAVDQTFAGSPLSAEAEFIFLPQAPVMKDTIIYLCDRDVALTAVGTNIEWFSDEALTNNVGSDVYSPQTTQTVYVTQTIAGMRGVGRRVQITIYDRPDAPLASPNPYFYCEGAVGSANINATGENIRWYKDAEKKVNAGTGNVLTVALTEQNYFVTQTIDGCESLPAMVPVKPLIIASEIHFEDNRIYTDEQNGTFYQWYRNDSPVPNSNTYFIDGVIEGDEYKVYIQKENCSETSGPTLITGIEEFEAGALKVFPNPTNANFTVAGDSNIKGLLRIYDVAGRIVFEKPFNDNSNGDLLVPSVTWSKGMYVIILTTPKNTISRKVLVK